FTPTFMTDSAITAYSAEEEKKTPPPLSLKVLDFQYMYEIMGIDFTKFAQPIEEVDKTARWVWTDSAIRPPTRVITEDKMPKLTPGWGRRLEETYFDDQFTCPLKKFCENISWNTKTMPKLSVFSGL